MSRKRIIGLAGGIGSGKSTVARVLRDLGCGIVDFDELAHEVLELPQVGRQLEQWWGPRILTAKKKLDRARIADIVFDDPAQRERLEALVHPLIDHRRQELFAQFERDDSIQAIVMDAPLLYETQLDSFCDRVVFVDCDAALRMGRVSLSRGWSEAEVRRRERSQAALEWKRRKADYIVVNNGSVDARREEIAGILAKILSDGGQSDGEGRLNQDENEKDQRQDGEDQDKGQTQGRSRRRGGKRAGRD